MKKCTLVIIALLGFMYSVKACAILPVRWDGIFRSAAFDLHRDSVHSLKVGDKVPDIIIGNVINANSRSYRLSDFKGKVLILDFWSSWCSGCVEFLPHVDSLNQELNGKAFILPVTGQPETVIEKFLANNGFLKGFKVISVVGDVVLKRLFPFNQYPQEVWIAPDGTVVAKTYADYVTKDNILKVLNGTKPDWMVKEDRVGFSDQKPLFFSPATVKSSAVPILFGSILAGHYPGVPRSNYVQLDPAKGMKRCTYINERLLDLYAVTLNSGLVFLPTRRILNVRHKPEYDFYPDSSHIGDWQSRHTYSFECTVPAATSEHQVLSDFLENLELLLHIKGQIVRKTLDCWVLKKLDKEQNLRSEFTKADRLRAHDPLDFRWVKTSDLVYAMSQREGYPPVFDGTIAVPRFDLKIDHWPRSLEEWNSVLRPAGLKLEVQRRNVDMFQLTEVPEKALVLSH